MTKFRSVLLAALTSLLIACPELGNQEPTTSGEIPENPTWTDVKPVLDRVCNDCHSNPPGDGGTGVPAPANIRLDVCETVGGILGAQSQAPRFVVRVIDQFPTPMPPTDYSAQPTPDEIELMRRWAEQGGTCEGSPNEPTNNQGTNNQMPNNQSNNQTPNNQTPNNTGDDMGMEMVDMGVDSGLDSGGDTAPAPTFPEIADILATSCADANCHAMAGGQGNLEFPNENPTDMEVQEALMGNATDPALAFVESGEPDQSAIYVRMSSDNPDYVMPPNEPLMMQTERVRAWIADGAPPFDQ